MIDLESIVLRTPGDEGEFKFYVAKMDREQARNLENRIASGDFDLAQAATFGTPLDLPEAMRRLDTRDFQVIDLAS